MVDKTILVVEDNKDDEALLLRALNKNDVNNKVVICRDGAEAIDWLFVNEEKEITENPDLIILDLKIPKICGLEVLRKIKSDDITKKIPVVVLTTSVEENDIRESYNLNANSFIKKPIDFVEFTNVVKVLSKYWLNLNQNIPRN